MSRYHLSEAYSSIYDSRLQEDFDDNLHFIDYMLDEDIEEVVESLFWEFRDYGHSIDESIDLLKFAASTEVINESLEHLCEALTPRQQQERAKFKNKQQADTQSTTTNKEGKLRQDRRKARVDGAISRVRAAWEGAKGGFGRAAKAVSRGVSKAGEFVSQQRQAGKAKLQKLIRTGANQASRTARNVGATVERTKRNITGETDRTQTARKRAKLQSHKDTRTQQAAAAVGKPFEKPEAKKATPALPPAKELSRREAAQQRAAKAAKGVAAKGKRFAPPAGSGVGAAAKRSNTGYSQAASRFAKQAGLSESDSFLLLDMIIEDLITEGYANTDQDAVNIINSLNEEKIYDISQEYLTD